GHHLHDAAHLLGEVGGHDVHRIGEVLPRAGDAWHLRLTAELALGAHLARHARHLGGEAVELIHHGVDGVLELENFAFHVHGDLARQVPARHGGGHLGNVADLCRQIAGHRIHAVSQVFPRSGNARHVRLTAQPTFSADLTRHARHLADEAVELIDHGVERLLELENLAAHVHRDLPRQVSIGNRGSHLGDVADLRGQIAGHRVHAVGQVLPSARHTWHLSLTAELTVGAHLARHARHLGGEGVQLVHHRVDG